MKNVEKQYRKRILGLKVMIIKIWKLSRKQSIEGLGIKIRRRLKIS